MSDAQRAAEMLIERTQVRLDGQSRDNDALDVKALGVVAVDTAIFALLAIVHHDALNRYWAVPASAIVLGGLLLIASVFPSSGRCRSKLAHVLRAVWWSPTGAFLTPNAVGSLGGCGVERKSRPLQGPPVRNRFPHQRCWSYRSGLRPLLPLTFERKLCLAPTTHLPRRVRRLQRRRSPSPRRRTSSLRRARVPAPKSAEPASPARRFPVVTR